MNRLALILFIVISLTLVLKAIEIPWPTCGSWDNPCPPSCGVLGCPPAPEPPDCAIVPPYCM